MQSPVNQLHLELDRIVKGAFIHHVQIVFNDAFDAFFLVFGDKWRNAPAKKPRDFDELTMLFLVKPQNKIIIKIA